MQDDFFEDLSEFDFGDEWDTDIFDENEISKKEKNKSTSETYAKKAKQFLEELQINLTNTRNIGIFYQIIFNTLKSINIPKIGEIYRIRTQTQTNLITIILKIVAQNVIEELTIATYTLNREAFDILCQLLVSGKIKKLNLLIASSYSFRDEEYYNLLKKKMQELSENGYNTHLTFAWSHAKITLIKCGENYYHMEGSMNYSQNNMVENLIFCNDKEVYNWDYDFIMRIGRDSNNKALEVIC